MSTPVDELARSIREPILLELVELRTELAELRRELAPAPVDAQTLAGWLGVSRDFVYRHKERLGGRPIGGGPRPRWRFDVPTARVALATFADRTQSDATRSSTRPGRS